MDTHITERPEIQVAGIDETVAPVSRSDAFDPLAGLGEAVSGLPGNAARKRRNGLKIAACGAVVLVAATGVFLISPYSATGVSDAKRLASQARAFALSNLTGLAPAAPVAPAANLARMPASVRSAAASGPGAAPLGDDMRDFLALGGRTAPSQAPAPIANPNPIATQAAPVATAAPPSRATMSTRGAEEPTAPLKLDGGEPSVVVSAAAVSPPAPPVAEAGTGTVARIVQPPLARVPEPAASPIPARPPAPIVAPQAPNDPIAVVALMRPEPMTESQQIQVLELVTKLGALIRDQRTEIAQLRTDQQHLIEKVDGALSDFGRRITLAEARGAVNAAMGVETRPTSAATSAGGPAQSAKPVVLPTATTTPIDMAGHRYHVQAASPGLAMLSELDPSGGEARQLPVSPGDDVPGWGKVVSISQHGTAWVVKTDHGLIQ